MKTNQLSSRLFRQLTLATITTVCLFTSTAHAILIAESQACSGSAPTGDATWVGAAYFPHTRTTVTHHRYETFNQRTILQADIWAFPEEDGPSVFNDYKQATSYPNQMVNSVAVSYRNQHNSPGHLLSFNSAWNPTISRWGGNYVKPDTPLNNNGCRKEISVF